jgi:acid phosphatase type 7
LVAVIALALLAAAAVVGGRRQAPSGDESVARPTPLFRQTATPPGHAMSPAPSATAGGDVAVLLGAGDIGTCGSDGDEATARLLDANEGTVFVAGDNAYDRGTARDFERCYGPTWGRHKARTGFPAPGNHDWETRGAAGYLDYFGSAARPDGSTWYRRSLGSWDVIVLDSECDKVGGCEEGSAQLDWLEATLARRTSRCTLAIWHRPRFSSGKHGNDPEMDAMWRALYAAGADVVINGHDHDYERFAPQDPDARPDAGRGIREFVVGTGGAELRNFDEVQPNSQVRESDTFGIIRLVLSADGYGWSFLPVADRTFSDSGTGSCH